ncbi:MAG: ATP-binding protein [Verrucomicrobiota bacterium]|jgi:PAS domain S-box-containing protein
MGEKQWFWATLTLSSITIVSVVFAAWELAENRFFRDADYLTLHYLYITRGVASSLVLAFWAAWFVLRQRRFNEEELSRSRERYRGLLEDFPGGVILYDKDLRVAEWNASAERMYGRAKAEILGRTLPTVPPGKFAELRELMARVEAGEAVLNIETTRLDGSGTPFPVQLSLRPFRERDGPVHFLEATSDIRERVRWREAMLELEKLTSMGKMAAGTAHHLNSPLAALLLRVQLMRERANGDRDLAQLEEGLKFCRHFVQRLLEFARMGPVDKQNQDLAATVESVASFFQPVIQAKRATLVTETSEAKGLQVWADRNLLETVLLILLSNASDAISAGGKICVTCHPLPTGSIEVGVSDTGPGISEANLARVFEPFFTTKEPGKGTGLGLAIAKNFVTEHGGSIRIESEAGQGATAYIDLPLAPEVRA